MPEEVPAEAVQCSPNTTTVSTCFQHFPKLNLGRRIVPVGIPQVLP